MKSGRRPTVKQKQAMLAAKLHPNEWLVVKNLSHEDDARYEVVSKKTGQAKVIPA